MRFVAIKVSCECQKRAMVKQSQYKRLKLKDLAWNWMTLSMNSVKIFCNGYLLVSVILPTQHECKEVYRIIKQHNLINYIDPVQLLNSVDGWTIRNVIKIHLVQLASSQHEFRVLLFANNQTMLTLSKTESSWLVHKTVSLT